jgi:hypothetical protein
MWFHRVETGAHYAFFTHDPQATPKRDSNGIHSQAPEPVACIHPQEGLSGAEPGVPYEAGCTALGACRRGAAG